MYQVIARKYRPQTFAEVVNQDHVKRTLMNAIEQGRVGHGYIFSGQRGTGKTTMARLLAKALNCPNRRGAEPCAECVSCQEIAAGASLDLMEIDAASNRRIDDIRELRENVRYRPVRDRYKIFIIDEAHQITTDAFNALLKTLEEPPEWVIFLLCTTEPQDIPATIASRCQSFPLRTIEPERVVERMQWICEQENIEAGEDALISIAIAGDGSLRDSLSTLDQAIACFGNRLEVEPVRELLGAIPTATAGRVIEALRESKPEAMLDIVDDLVSEGRHIQHFTGELARYFRNLLVLKVAGPETRLVMAGKADRAAMAEAVETFSQEDLTRYLNLLLELYRDLQKAPQPRFRVEVGLLKLVYAGRLAPLEDVLANWSGGEPGSATEPPGRKAGGARVSSRASSAPLRRAETQPPAESPKAQSPPPAAAETEPESKTAPPANPVPAPAPTKASQPAEGETAPRPADSGASGGTGAAFKQAVVERLRQAGHDFAADAVEHAEVTRSEKEVQIRPAPMDAATLEFSLRDIGEAVQAAAGRKIRVAAGKPLDEAAAAAVNGSAAQQGAAGAAAAAAENETLRRALEDPEVQRFQQLFEGRIREARNLKEYS